MSTKSSRAETHVPHIVGDLSDVVLEAEERRGRFGLADKRLREVTARGVIVNSAFQAAFAGLTLLQRFAIAAFLTTEELGVWGLSLSTLITLSWLKQIGISDKYVQQQERDQELAFQKAFTLELAYTFAFCGFLVAVLPLYAVLYGRPEILPPSVVLATVLIAGALSTPVWIAYREMRFVTQRLLEAVNPVVSTLVMLPLAVAGAGYWSLVIGVVVGAFAGAAVALITCPYRLAVRFDRGTMREYFGFSWPLLIMSGSGLLVVQGTLIVANFEVGLAGLGALTLASSLLVYAQRVDDIISRTIYPAICAVRERTDLLLEAFLKSNRLALMWGLPFGVGLFLFAPDLVQFVLGDRWRTAEGVLQGMGLVAGFRQIGFNWNLFFQATGRTKPMAVTGLASVLVFFAVIAPAIAISGLGGFVVGMSVLLAVELVLRNHYLSRLFPGTRPLARLVRSLAPCVAGAAAVLLIRAITPTDTLGAAGVEFVTFVVVTIGATLWFERGLIAEMVGYVRGTRRPAASAEGRVATAA